MKHLTSIMTNVTDNGKETRAFFSRTIFIYVLVALASWKLRDRSHDTTQKMSARFFWVCLALLLCFGTLVEEA